MSQVVIKQGDWEAPFIPIIRNDNLLYSVDLYSLFARSPVVDSQVQKCTFCKAFPFIVSEPPQESKVKECDLCQGLNQYDMRHHLIDRGEESEHLSNCYITKPTNMVPKKVNLIIFIECFEKEFTLNLTAALKSILEIQPIQASILVTYRDKLALVDFLEEPQLIILSKDLCVRQTIQQYKRVLTVEMIDGLQKILMTLSSQAVNKKDFSYEILQEILIDFQGKRPHMVQIMIWIGKFPQQIKRVPLNCLKIIAILLIDRKIQRNFQLFELDNQVAQAHYLYGEQAATQLYYELHTILSDSHLGLLIEGVVTLKTDQQYSGSFLNPPKKLINCTTAPSIVTTNQNTPHKLQFNIEFCNLQGEHLQFICNLYENGKRKSVEWHQRVILISNALIHVLSAYCAIPVSPNKPKQDITAFFIMNELDIFLKKYQNNTKYYQDLLSHVKSYFKEFQKTAAKLYLPFSLIFRKELLFVFYPLWQGGILYHYDSMWVGSEGEENVEWINEVMRVSYTPREAQVPVFYSLCVDKESYSFIQQ